VACFGWHFVGWILLRVIGNPAAGSAKGSGKDAQAYRNKCVKNGGKVDDDSSKNVN